MIVSVPSQTGFGRQRYDSLAWKKRFSLGVDATRQDTHSTTKSICTDHVFRALRVEESSCCLPFLFLFAIEALFTFARDELLKTVGKRRCCGFYHLFHFLGSG